jgi:hypothetical protein
VLPFAKRGISLVKGRVLHLRAVLPAAEHLQFALMLVLVIGITSARLDYYFNQHIPAYNQQYRDYWGHRDAQDAVLRSLHFPPGTEIHIINRGTPLDMKVTRGLLDFMASDLSLDAIPSDDRRLRAYLAGLNDSVDHAFYVGPYNTQAVDLLRQRFDLLPPQASPYDLPVEYQYILYYAPARTTIP